METYRIFSFVCYEDSDNLQFDKIMENIENSSYTYFLIKHDNDTNKIHYHFAIYSKSACSKKQISKDLDIDENYIRVKDDLGDRYTLKKTIGYFLHYNNKDKFNYSYDNLITNNKDLLDKYFNLLNINHNEKEELKDILYFISYSQCSSTDLMFYCIDNDYMKTFKKYSYFLSQVVKENRYK